MTVTLFYFCVLFAVFCLMPAIYTVASICLGAGTSFLSKRVRVQPEAAVTVQAGSRTCLDMRPVSVHNRETRGPGSSPGESNFSPPVLCFGAGQNQNQIAPGSQVSNRHTMEAADRADLWPLVHKRLGSTQTDEGPDKTPNGQPFLADSLTHFPKPTPRRIYSLGLVDPVQSKFSLPTDRACGLGLYL